MTAVKSTSRPPPPPPPKTPEAMMRELLLTGKLPSSPLSTSSQGSSSSDEDEELFPLRGTTESEASTPDPHSHSGRGESSNNANGFRRQGGSLGGTRSQNHGQRTNMISRGSSPSSSQASGPTQQAPEVDPGVVGTVSHRPTPSVPSIGKTLSISGSGRRNRNIQQARRARASGHGNR
jgi:hypothetical protein